MTSGKTTGIQPSPGCFQARHSLAAAIGLTVLALLIYAGTFQAPFVFDDYPNIADNHSIRMTELTPTSLALALQNRGRPLANFSFAINYYLNRYEVTGYHLINLGIHIVTALAVFFLAGQTQSLYGTGNNLMPFFAASLWLVNPLHTLSVTYIVQRMNSLATLFFVLSLACYIQARLSQNHGAGRGKVILWFTGCGLTAAAGLASKEIVAVLPLMIFLYEWFFLKNLNRAWLKRQSGRASLMVVLLIAIALVYLGDTPLERLLLMYKNRGFSPAQRMLTEPQVVIYYMALLAFPHPARLNLDYDFPLVLSPISPGTALPAMMALTALAVAAGYAAKRHRLLSFAIFWFLGTLFIESSFIGLDLIFEYRAYLPSIFPVIALTVLVFRHVRPRSAALVLLSAVIMVCSLWTWQRNGAWNSPVALWHECALKSPQQARPANNLGHAWWKGRRQPREALPWFQKAVSLNPGYYDALNNLGGVLMDLGRPDEAIPPLKRAIALAPGKPGAYANLGAALNATGRPEEAVASYLTSIRISDEEAVRNNLGTVLMERGDRENAIVQFNQAIRINPEFPDAHNNLGVAMMQAGRAREAVHYFQRALELNPAYAQAHANLGTALLQAGDLEQARRHLRQAVDLDPGLMTAMNTMASVLVMQKQYAAAAETLERLAGQFPQNPTIRYNLACAYALQNKRNEAVACLKQAVDLGYGNREHIRTDPDLANIRGTEYYQELFGEKP